MLSRTEIEQLLAKIPSGYKDAKEDFFEASNKRLSSYRKLGVIPQNKPESEGEGAKEKTTTVQKIFCNAPNCKQAYDSVADYQMHFNNQHRFICAECRRSLPTAHLLDLHIMERHDHYFAASLERGTQPMYRCLLEQCDLRFYSPEERKDHCIKTHKFPANYRYDQLAKSSGANTLEMPMELDGNVGVVEKQRLKNISFGMRSERCFHTSGKQNKSKTPPVPAVERMDDLQQALLEIV